MLETIISIISIVLAFLSFLLAFFSFKNSREAKYKANQPTLTLSELKLFLDRFELYGGEKVSWGKNKFLRGANHEEHVLNNTQRTTMLEHNNKNYLLINFCPKDISTSKKAVIAFDAINIKVDFSNNEVAKLRLKKVFSIAPSGESFVKNFMVDAEFFVSGSTLEVPVAYACIYDHPTAIHLQKIYRLKKSLFKSIKKTPVNLLQSRGNADDYIGFVETGYLLECKTIDGYIYEYSLYMKINENGTLVLEKIQNGSKLFDEKVNGRKGIVQEAPPKKEWKNKIWFKKL